METQITQEELKETRKFAKNIGLVWEHLTLEFQRVFSELYERGEFESNKRMNYLIENLLSDSQIIRFFIGEADRSEEGRISFMKKLKQDLFLGNILSDLGKNGPIDAEDEQKELVHEIFKIQNISLNELYHLTISEFIEKYLTYKTHDELEKILESMHEYGVSKNMVMRSFYNLHLGWSLSYIEHEVIPKRAKMLVRLHHYLDRNLILNADINIQMEDVPMEAIIIMLVDKYDAFRHRSKHSHEKAMRFIEHIIIQYGLIDREWENSKFWDIYKALNRIAPRTIFYGGTS